MKLSIRKNILKYLWSQAFIKLIDSNKDNMLLQLNILDTYCSTADYSKDENIKSKSIINFITCFNTKQFMK